MRAKGEENKMSRHHTWQWLDEWAGRMSKLYGGVVYDGGKKLDWGQAMCRAAYGPDWMTDADFQEFDKTSDSKPASKYVIEVCKRWEAGKWPGWARSVQQIKR